MSSRRTRVASTLAVQDDKQNIFLEYFNLFETKFKIYPRSIPPTREQIWSMALHYLLRVPPISFGENPKYLLEEFRKLPKEIKIECFDTRIVEDDHPPYNLAIYDIRDMSNVGYTMEMFRTLNERELNTNQSIIDMLSVVLDLKGDMSGFLNGIIKSGFLNFNTYATDDSSTLLFDKLKKKYPNIAKSLSSR